MLHFGSMGYPHSTSVWPTPHGLSIPLNQSSNNLFPFLMPSMPGPYVSPDVGNLPLPTVVPLTSSSTPAMGIPTPHSLHPSTLCWPPLPPPPPLPKLPRIRDEDMNLLPKWLAGTQYGPVLDLAEAALLNVSIEINPLFANSSDPNDPTFLRYNIIFPISTAHLKSDPPKQSWQTRNEPFCIPRLKRITIISKHFKESIQVNAKYPKRGVTCGDVVKAIHRFAMEPISRDEYNKFGVEKQAKINTVYHHNRSTDPSCPGGTLDGCVLRGDILAEYTLLGGIVQDNGYVSERFGLQNLDSSHLKARLLKGRKMMGVFVLELRHSRGGKDIHVTPGALDQARHNMRKLGAGAAPSVTHAPVSVTAKTAVTLNSHPPSTNNFPASSYGPYTPVVPTSMPAFYPFYTHMVSTPYIASAPYHCWLFPGYGYWAHAPLHSPNGVGLRLVSPKI